jgi:hypothetical protein
MTTTTTTTATTMTTATIAMTPPSPKIYPTIIYYWPSKILFNFFKINSKFKENL